MYGQIDSAYVIKQVNDSLVVVDINTIKEVNIKLRERLALKEIVEQQDSIINSQKNIVDSYKGENLYLATENHKLIENITSAEELNKKLSKSLNRKNTWLAITGGVAAATTIGMVVSLLVSYAK